MKKSDETPTAIVPEQIESSDNIDVHSQGNTYKKRMYIMIIYFYIKINCYI